jgi:hypothetical protein
MTPEIPIELRCPQCSAPVTLEESDRILSCAFCRVRLCLSFNGAARYCLSAPDLPDENLIYVPYWRYRGMSFTVQGLEIRHRVADNSHLATHVPGLPSTLGFRPQVLRLKPMVPGRGNRFLQPQRSFEQVRTGTNGSGSQGLVTWGEPDPPGTYAALIGETVHLVYSPVVPKEDVLWDPVLRRPLAGADADALERMMPGPAQREILRFLPMICPKCGWDLAGEKDTLVPVCRNCHTLWDSKRGGLSELPYGVASRGNPGDIYLPFWAIRARTPELQLETQADLIRLANVPKLVRQTMEERSLVYLVSAFKVHPQLFLRLARTFTLSQPDARPGEELPKAPLHPVTLPLDEALEILPVLVGSLAVPKKTYLPLLGRMRFQHLSSQLVFFPFTLKGGELLQPDLGIVISRNALNMGRLI